MFRRRILNPSIPYSGIVVKSFTVDDIPASGGKINSGRIEYQQVKGMQTITTGATITYYNKDNPSSAEVVAPSLNTTVKQRTQVGTLVAHIYLNGKERDVEVSVYQQANQANYGQLENGSITYTDIEASGGNATRNVVTPTQTITYTSGANRKGNVYTIFGEQIIGDNLGTQLIPRTRLGTQTDVFYGENSQSLTFNNDIYQEENKVVSIKENGYEINTSVDKTTVSNLGSTINIINNTGLSNLTDVYTSGAEQERTETFVPESLTISGAGFTLSGNTITVSSYTGNTERTAILTIKYKDVATKTITITQQKGVVTFSEITITKFTVADIPASGGTISKGTVEYSQTWGYNGQITGGGTITTGANISYSKEVTVESLARTVRERTSIGNLTVTVSLNGKTASKTVDVYQQANVESYSELQGGSATASDIPASGGNTANVVNKTAPTQIVSYTSGSTRAGTVNLASDTPADVTVDNLTTTVKERTKIITKTFAYTGEGSKTKNITIDIYQAANEKLTTYGAWSVSISADKTILPGSGGTATITSQATRNRADSYTSGSVVNTTETASTTLSIKGDGFTLSGNKVTASNYTVQKDRTCVVTATYYSISNSITITQSSATITYSDIVINDFETDLIPPSGDFDQGTYSFKYIQTWGYNGQTTGGGTITSGLSYDVEYNIDYKLMIDLQTTERPKTKVGTATLTLSGNGKTATKTIDVYEDANVATYAVPTVTLSYPKIPASGGKVNPTISYNQRVNYTSNSYKNITNGAQLTYSGGVNTDGSLTVSSLLSTVKPETILKVVTVTVALNGKSGTTTANIVQAANNVSYTIPTVTMTYPEVRAVGGSVFPKVTYSQTATYTSGTVVVLNTGATLSYTGKYINAKTGELWADTLGKTIKDRHKVTSSTVSVNLNGLVGTASADIYQQENKVTYNWDIELSADPNPMPATATTSTITATASGSKVYTSMETEAMTGTPTLAITSNPDNVFTLSGTTISVPANTTDNQRTCVVTATINGEGDKPIGGGGKD